MSMLSGWLPDDNGLDPLRASLIDAFETEYSEGHNDPPQVVVVGVLDAVSVKHKLGAEPTVELKFSTIEAATGARADQLRFVLAGLKSARTNAESLTGVDDAIARMLAGDDSIPDPPPQHDVRGDGAGNPTRDLRPGITPEWSDPEDNR